MKYSILIIFFIVATGSIINGQENRLNISTPNFIDSIQKKAQIDSLLAAIDGKYSYFKVNQSLKFVKDKYSETDCQKIADSLGVNPWYKADFDNNGLTDILVIGEAYDFAILCIMDMGNNQYKINPLTIRTFQECTFPIMKREGNIPIIDYYFMTNLKDGEWDKPRKLEKIKLIYKFGDFVELNEKPSKHSIQKIEYSTFGCLGSCPAFRLFINVNNFSKWEAKFNNSINGEEYRGLYTTKINKKDLSMITDLLNYMDFTRMDSSYSVSWSDAQFADITIIYDNGKVKKIRDYGKIGTYGLNRLHTLLFKLRENQDWVKQ
jgi:hypothetical protein